MGGQSLERTMNILTVASSEGDDMKLRMALRLGRRSGPAVGAACGAGWGVG